MRIVDVNRLGGQVCTPTSEVASTGVNKLALLTMKPSHTPPWWNVGTMPTKERETILWDNGVLKKNTFGPEDIPKTIIL